MPGSLLFIRNFASINKVYKNKIQRLKGKDVDRSFLKDKKRIVVKIGTSTITHTETGNLNLDKLEKFVRVLTDLHNQNKEIIIVSSGAVGAGRKALGIQGKPKTLSIKQACAAVGQARLMMIYQKLFAEYNQTIAQILITKRIMINDISRTNAENTFQELLGMGVIPIVNENDPISTDQIGDEIFGDNDTLSANVAELVQADLLILLSDIDGLYTDDPRNNKDAKFIDYVENIDGDLEAMAKGAESTFGTGGMTTKVAAAKIANDAGVDMVIANGDDVHNVTRIINGEQIGTLFKAVNK
ncbi:MAG: glutamate 5-kinase [Lachnospiraceae bacterium]|nr:glutamate 5-kinase [Lachnospiraceae bacterium]